MYKPSDKEQEYFVRAELERLRRLREESMQRKAEEELAKLKELHWMHCPKCGTSMEVTHLSDVEVEVCPGCGGIYLDAGEIDKIVEDRRRGPFAGALKAVRAVFQD